MILDHSRKMGVFFVPKTGSATVCSLFKDYSLDENIHNHKDLSRVIRKNPDIDFSTYQFWAFYRDPVDRFLSALVYQRRAPNFSTRFLHYFLGDQALDISCLAVNSYSGWSSDQQAMLESVSLQDFLTSNFITDADPILFKNQIDWLNYSNVTLLNYGNFASEIQVLATAWGIAVPDPLPNINTSVKLPTDPTAATLDPATLQQIKDLYRADYQFFASKGISF